MGFDKHLESGSPATVATPFNDSVITSREQQSTYNSSRQSQSTPQEFHLADSPVIKTEDEPSNGLLHDLVYRTTINPVEEQCGALLANFDSMTKKMSHMFKDKLIKKEDGFTGSELAAVVNDHKKMSKFSPTEQDTLKVLNENSEKVFGDPSVRLHRQDVVDYAEKLGILKRT